MRAGSDACPDAPRTSGHRIRTHLVPSVQGFDRNSQLDSPRRLQDGEGVDRDPFVLAPRTCPSPVYIVGVGFHGLRTDDLVVASLRRPPSVRQLPMKEPLCQGIGTLIRDPKVRKEIERVSLLGCTATIATLHDGDTRVQIRLIFRPRHELLEVTRLEPEFQDPVSNRVEGLVAPRVAEVCEAG